MKKEEWFNDERFWQYYGPIMFDDAHWAEVPAVADGVTRLARLNLYPEEEAGKTGPLDKGQTRPRVLDLCCGFGRISLELAQRGFQVTGVDITKTYLDCGRDDAAYEGLDVEFVESDVRDFVRPAVFDLAVNLYISFGYFQNPADDLLFARNAFQSLKPGGSLIIETLGKEMAVRDFTKGEWFERAGCLVLTEYAPFDAWAGLKNRWVLINKASGRHREKTFIQRLYAASELRALLFKAGFASVELYGSWGEAPYDQDAQALIAVGRKAF
jgi:SAM-dependent methyltransferase